MNPIIGVSSNLKGEAISVPTANVHAIARFDGVPIVLPNLQDAGLDIIVDRIDGLLLTGGGDIDPTLFGEEPHPRLGSIVPERDAFEIQLVQKMLEKNKPILGICRGAQILSIAAGGDMYQDIYAQSPAQLLQHDQQAPNWYASHFVHVTEGTILSNVAGVEKFKVNSFHHQAVRNVPNGFLVSGIASDGIIEAFESKNHPFVMGIQWHPESLLMKDDLISAAIFERFIDACVK
ncbi:gamma-glutamyl-gamma-aminobutyrate hydrolase family protein [Psychrobacillus lasiicapitis]|uniref:Gamma-glutamyl-gamma-aminobutyrate hydrolase family protein n=1 Tax=Psychrobacillus lasiicapitis TaxID=1636719 RepID=A0A544T2W2_9BACI|nr:gamma-glutamyl-gamma-aminobutyrate hydrolase family protein [Psychrobacillus lasiicapitis]TQR11783.1 gamma-glutamyl-gamma-aminobutyrate hydrolase family protein [Psychrobacillus lasiicapitis]GGA19367.1 peptidase C26 [Psychrobacillus lasiicapitis]